MALEAAPALASVLLLLLGWGLLAERVLFGAHQRERGLDWPELGLAGVFALTTLGLFFNLVVPLDDHVVVPAALLGAGALVWRRARLLAAVRSARLGGLAVPALLFLACPALGMLHGSEYETGLYHLPVLLSEGQSPVPLGVANLQWQQANNSAWLVFAGLLRLPLLGLRGPFSANLALYVLILGALYQESRARSRPTATLALLALAALTLSSGRFALFQGGSPATDAPGMLLVLFSLVLAAGLASVRQVEEQRRRLALLALASVLAVTVKLACLPALLLAPAAALALRKRAPRSLPLRELLPPRVVAAAALLLALWAARSLAASGCLLYPVPFTCATFLPWTLPAEVVRDYQESVTTWARGHPAGDSAGLGWVRSWAGLVADDRTVVAMAAVAVLSLGALLGAPLVRRWHGGARASRRFASLSAYAPPLLVCLLGLALWLLGAPDPRFAYGFILGAPLLLLAMALDGLGLFRLRKTAARWLRPACLGSLAFQSVLAALVLSRAPAGFWPEIGRAEVAMTRASDGTPVAVAQHPPGPGALCWDTPQPCTPLLLDGLVVDWQWGRPRYRLLRGTRGGEPAAAPAR